MDHAFVVYLDFICLFVCRFLVVVVVVVVVLFRYFSFPFFLGHLQLHPARVRHSHTTIDRCQQFFPLAKRSFQYQKQVAREDCYKRKFVQII